MERREPEGEGKEPPGVPVTPSYSYPFSGVLPLEAGRAYINTAQSKSKSVPHPFLAYRQSSERKGTTLKMILSKTVNCLVPGR